MFYSIPIQLLQLNFVFLALINGNDPAQHKKPDTYNEYPGKCLQEKRPQKDNCSNNNSNSQYAQEDILQGIKYCLQNPNNKTDNQKQEDQFQH